MTIIRASLLLAFLLPVCNSATAGEAAPDPKAQVDPKQRAEARKLAADLGAESYSVRHRAQLELIKLGKAAVEVLQDAVFSEDSEVRTKALAMLVELRGRGFLGVQMREELDDDSPPPADDKERTKPTVAIMSVPPSKKLKPSPAEAAELKAGDMFVSVNGNRVLGVKDLQREVIIAGPASMAVFEVLRDQALLRIPVVLTRNDDDVPIVDLENDDAPEEKELKKPEEPVVKRK